MAHTNSWDETSPTNATLATSIDDEIRKLRIDVRERLAIDHNLTTSDAGAATVGYHKQITFEDDLASDPGKTGDVTSLYPKKLAAGRIVPFFEDSTSVVRVLLGDTNMKAWLYTATAPVGWKASSGAPTDCALVAQGGSTYTTAGATAGTWTISGISAHAAHNHQWHKWDSGQAFSQRSRSWKSDGSTTDWFEVLGGTDERGNDVHVGSADPAPTAEDWYTKNTTVGAHTFDGTWRISGAVNKLYEPDTTL